MTAGLLPPLPEGCEYMVIEGCVARHLADIEMLIFAKGREEAASIAAFLPPMAARWSDDAPVFRPTCAFDPESHLKSKSVWPIIYTAFYDESLPEDAGRYQANLTWYWQPIPQHPFNVVVNVSIRNDEGRCYANDLTGLPEGQVEIISRSDGKGRSAFVYWPHDVKNWLEKLLSVTDDEWPLDIFDAEIEQ